MSDKPNIALAENLVTLLAHNDKHGRIVANILDPSLFEGEYRLVAERIIDYWDRYDEAPKAHTADLFSDILEDSANRRAKPIRRILMAMLDLADNVNVRYVTDQLHKFSRMQHLKEAILNSAERLNAQQEMAIDEVEELWAGLLRKSETGFDPGIKLTDFERIISDLDTNKPAEFVMGVRDLDKRGVYPHRGEVILFLGAKGTGKSWAAVHVGKSNLLRRKKVLHISLEMSEERVAQRYYQSLFSVTKRDSKVKVTLLEKDEYSIVDIQRDVVNPEFTFSSNVLSDELHYHAASFGSRMENLIIKRFPTRSLTVKMLEGYLDNLEVTQKFIPDLLVLDYIGIMKTDTKNPRISLGHTFEDMRGLLIKRNIAGFVPHQVGRAAVDAKLVAPTHVAEDWSLIHTADQVVTLSQTKTERKLGLARLFVGHSRDESDGFGCIITQSYDLGQFVLDSAFLKASYFDVLKDFEDSDEYDEDDE